MQLKLTAFLLLALIFASCAPSKMFVHTNAEYEHLIAKTPSIGIINDVCLKIDPLFKKDYQLLDNSKIAELFMAEAAKSWLEQKGYQVSYSASPFVGSFLPPESTFRVSDEKGGEIQNIQPPFYSDETMAADTIFMKSLQIILKEVYSFMAGNNQPVFSSNTSLLNSLQLIADRTGNDIILFMIGNGSIVPLGKTIFLGVATSLLTMGIYIYSIYNVTSFDSYLALIDLHTGELLWSNSMRIEGNNPARNNFYTSTWSKNLLYYYPLREGFVMKK